MLAIIFILPSIDYFIYLFHLHDGQNFMPIILGFSIIPLFHSIYRFIWQKEHNQNKELKYLLGFSFILILVVFIPNIIVSQKNIADSDSFKLDERFIKPVTGISERVYQKAVEVLAEDKRDIGYQLLFTGYLAAQNRDYISNSIKELHLIYKTQAEYGFLENTNADYCAKFKLISGELNDCSFYFLKSILDKRNLSAIGHTTLLKTISENIIFRKENHLKKIGKELADDPEAMKIEKLKVTYHYTIEMLKSVNYAMMRIQGNLAGRQPIPFSQQFTLDLSSDFYDEETRASIFFMKTMIYSARKLINAINDKKEEMNRSLASHHQEIPEWSKRYHEQIKGYQIGIAEFINFINSYEKKYLL